VALIISSKAQRALMSYHPVDNRIITARFRTGTGAVTIMQVYAPTGDSSDQDISSFYDTNTKIDTTQKLGVKKSALQG